MAESVVISKRKTKKIRVTKIGDVNIKLVQKFKYLGYDDRKGDTEITICIGLTEEAFQILYKDLRNGNFFYYKRIKSARLLCGICPLIWQWMPHNLLTDEEETKISINLVLQKDNENTMDRTNKQQWSLENAYRKNIYLQNQEEAVDILTYNEKGILGIMRNECLENSTLTGYIEGNRDRGRQRAEKKTRLCELMAEQGTWALGMGENLLRGKKLWTILIAYVPKRHDTEKKKRSVDKFWGR